MQGVSFVTSKELFLEQKWLTSKSANCNKQLSQGATGNFATSESYNE